MTKFLYIALLFLCPVLLMAQSPVGSYNPYVNGGVVAPSPLLPFEANGKGVMSFNFGNSGNNSLEIYPNQYITLTITLSYGIPDHANPISAVGGSSAALFSWTYSAGTYTAIQIASIPSKYEGKITIAYKTSKNSSSPGLNGFNINISPAPYQTTSNAQGDDAVSSYTFTEIRDFGDCPASYGSADHVIDFANYLGTIIDGESSYLASSDADADDTNGQDDEDGVVFPASISQGETINIPVTVAGMGRLNAWFDWNSDGDFSDDGEFVVQNVARFSGTVELSVTVPVNAVVSSSTFARFRISPETLFSSIGSSSGGEVEDYLITISESGFAPTVPADLKIDSSSVSYVSISWSASSDQTGVTGYRIYREGVFLGTSSNTNYTDNSVSIGNSYTYSVSAYNAAGYESAQSVTVTASTADTEPPTTPAGLTILPTELSVVSLQWNTSSDNVGVANYGIYRDGIFLENSSTPDFTDNSVSLGNNYVYTVSAFDATGNESVQSAAVTASTNDTIAPTVPQGLIIVTSSVDEVSISWSASSDNVGVSGYLIYREGSLLETIIGLTFTDSTITSGNTYNYSVSATDEAGNISLQSDIVSASTNDTIPPTVPSGLLALSASEAGLSLSWDASSDNVEVTGYKVYREGVLLSEVNELFWTDKIIQAGSTHTYSVSSFDAAGNESQQCETITISLSATEFIIVSELSCYPNPSDGTFSIDIGEVSGEFILEIISALGNINEQSLIIADGTLLPFSFTDLKPGIYYIRLFNNERMYYGKVMIQ